MDSFNKRLNDFLQSRKDAGLLRSLKISGNTQIDFCSNDYLGLSRSEELFNNIHKRLGDLNLRYNGATGSRLLSGNSLYLLSVEEKLSHIFKSEDTLIFNSGYTANLAVLSSIAQRSDTIIYDELSHASIKDGTKLSLANRFSFRHNDLHDLEQKLKRCQGKVFITVESVYSMDGDQCPLTELVVLAEKYNAHIILDEAHSTGVYGEKGSGLAVSLGIQDRIDIRIYTFGKAMGIHGACVAGSKYLKEYLINTARACIYTTAPPPVFTAAIDCSFDYLHENICLQNQLREKIDRFKNATDNIPGKLPSQSAIQAFIVSGSNTCREYADNLQQNGFDIRPILSPTVRESSERIRICLHTFNSDMQIEDLARTLSEKHPGVL